MDREDKKSCDNCRYVVRAKGAYCGQTSRWCRVTREQKSESHVCYLYEPEDSGKESDG